MACYSLNDLPNPYEEAWGKVGTSKDWLEDGQEARVRVKPSTDTPSKKRKRQRKLTKASPTTFRKYGIWLPFDLVVKALKLLEKGVTQTEVRKELGLTDWSVSKIVQNMEAMKADGLY